MTMPSSVIIAGQVFSIAEEPRAHLNGDVDARIAPAQQRIRIADDLGPDAERETVLHEVIHGIRALSGFSRREREVQALAVQLLDVLRRNPDFAAWLVA